MSEYSAPFLFVSPEYTGKGYKARSYSISQMGVRTTELELERAGLSVIGGSNARSEAWGQAVLGVVVTSEGILLQRRNDERYCHNKLAVVTGKLESLKHNLLPTEPYTSGVIREVGEELGIRVQYSDLEPLGVIAGGNYKGFKLMG